MFLIFAGKGVVNIDPDEMRLSAIDAANIDLNLEFHAPLKENMIIYALGYWSTELSYDENGLPMDPE